MFIRFKKKKCTSRREKKREDIHNCIVKEILFKDSLISISKQIKAVSNKVDRQKEKLRAILVGKDNTSYKENDIEKKKNFKYPK